MPNEATPPSRDEWAEWKVHPVTKWYFGAVRVVQAGKETSLASGVTLKPNADDTAQSTAKAIGAIHGLEIALELEPDLTEVQS